MSSLYDFTIAEIVLHLEERAFPRDHIIELSQDSWQLEHPIRCRLMQYDEALKIMHTLRETCAINHAMEHGLAETLVEKYGFTRFILSALMLENLMSGDDQ